MHEIPKSHPRYSSLRERGNLVEGVKEGITSIHGLLAHGRGEAFDYLIGEKTIPSARKAIQKAADLLVSARHPVISINGNTAALCAEELIELADSIPALLEVNLFYWSAEREKKIAEKFAKLGAKIEINKSVKIPKLESERAKVSEQGIWKADVVLVPLEDGNRTEALRAMGKKVIAIDLNPLSRTSKKANVTIVDNVTRAIPLLTKEVRKIKRNRKEIKKMKLKDKRKIKKTKFSNAKNLQECMQFIVRLFRSKL